jgi:hypothetical protein
MSTKQKTFITKSMIMMVFALIIMAGCYYLTMLTTMSTPA